MASLAREIPLGAQLTLRVDPDDSPALAAIGRALGVAPPTTPNTVASSDEAEINVLWLGPDEWLVVALGRDPGALEAEIREAVGDAFVTVVDVSAGRIALELDAPHARTILERGCALDLDPRRFGPGSCAQTLLARAQVILWALGSPDEPRYRLLIRPSFATYVLTWLADSEVDPG